MQPLNPQISAASKAVCVVRGSMDRLSREPKRIPFYELCDVASMPHTDGIADRIKSTYRQLEQWLKNSFRDFELVLLTYFAGILPKPPSTAPPNPCKVKKYTWATV